MTDLTDIHYNSNFLLAIIGGEYEGDKPLPDVMNLLEHDGKGNTALHYCARKGFFSTLVKILECDHPAVGLLVVYRNYYNRTALDFLLQNKNLSESYLNDILEKMGQRCLSKSFFDILKSSLKYEKANKKLTESLKTYYDKVMKSISSIQDPSYTPTYSHTHSQQKITNSSGLLSPHEQGAIKSKNSSLGLSSIIK